MDYMTDDTRTSDQQEDESVIVVGPDGRPLGTVGTDGNLKPEEPGNLIEQPAKVMRIGSMIKQLLEEVRAAPLDEASRGRLKEIHERSIKELEDGLAPELQEELERHAGLAVADIAAHQLVGEVIGAERLFRREDAGVCPRHLQRRESNRGESGREQGPACQLAFHTGSNGPRRNFLCRSAVR